MANRELVMLAKTFDKKMEATVDPAMWLCSEKLDGMRALWVPHTVGLRVGDIPWANRERDTRDHIATGLWSRYAKPIFAPKWFTSYFPPDTCLDGELWLGRQNFNKLMSVVKKHTPVDNEWGNVDFWAFDAPHYDALFAPGRVNNVNYKHVFDGSVPVKQPGDSLRAFETTYFMLKRLVKQGTPYLKVLEQHRLLRWDAVYKFCEDVGFNGGEGVMMRRMSSIWAPRRIDTLLKIKPWSDEEGTVIGWTPGVGKYEGMMGSLKIRMANGKEFDLSGFTDEERKLGKVHYTGFSEWPEHFQRSTKITYRYRELTPDGLPREARYHRKHVEL